VSAKSRVDALYVIIDPFISVNQVQVNTLARDAQLPKIARIAGARHL